MNGLFKAALEVQTFMTARSWCFCLIGGLAVIRWGEPRMTQDIDVSLLTGFGQEDAYIQELLTTFPGRLPNTAEFARRHRVLLLSTSNGTSVDVSLAGLPFEEELIARATPFDFAPECSLLTCSAEDVILLKAFADRAKDWMDIEGILIRQRNQLEFEHIFDRLKPLCELKEAPEIPARLHELIATVEASC
jgi:hypothetical protein